jgi:hypothetical protein
MKRPLKDSANLLHRPVESKAVSRRISVRREQMFASPGNYPLTKELLLITWASVLTIDFVARRLIHFPNWNQSNISQLESPSKALNRAVKLLDSLRITYGQSHF